MPTPVDEYIAGFPPSVRKILREVRATIRRAAPGADETISYRIPAFRLDGRTIVFFAGFKQHIGMYPPVKAAALKKAVERYAGPKGNLQFPLDEKMPHALISRIVKSKVEEAEARPNRKRAKT